jgi:3-oxoacyl-[acyl-carrier-protein] synthase II
MTRRVVITGIGLVTPLGVGTAESWRRALAGESGIGPITYFDTTDFATKFAGEVKGFKAEDFLEKRDVKTMDPFIHLGMAAALMAMKDSGLVIDDSNADRVGVYCSAGLGGLQTIERTHKTLMEKGPRHGISVYFIPALIVNLLAGQASIRLGARGPSMAHVSACSSSAHSIGEAFALIRGGLCDAMIAGGAEAVITPLGVGGFNAMRALSTRNDSPTEASRPFDNDRDGFVMGEGAGVLILEELESAKKRGARIYAELCGYSATSDAHHMTAPSLAGPRRCMQQALAMAGLNLDQVGYINAHGTSTKQGDANETRAIKEVFGDHAKKLAVSSTKSMTGHLLGAAGGVETIFTALAVHHGVLPPTINQHTPDPDCDLDYVPNQARETRVEAALSNSFGFGGTNATLALRRFS